MGTTKKITQQEALRLGTDHQFVASMTLGPWTTYSLLHDPKHMGFVLARYKFCAKMLEGKRRVLEVGCGDGFGIPVVAQHVESILGIDPIERLIRGDKKRLAEIKNIEFKTCDICQNAPDGTFDASYSIDVIEHLDRGLDKPFMENQLKCLTENGVCIIGTPNITANKYASYRSRVQHINLKSQAALRRLLEKYFRNVFTFSMNDEVLHTGYAPMAHYIFGMGVGKR